MTPLQEITYSIVKELRDKHIAEHREPVNVSMLDIQRAINELVKSALNGLVEDGMLSWFSNLNGIAMFNIKNPNK